KVYLRVPRLLDRRIPCSEEMDLPQFVECSQDNCRRRLRLLLLAAAAEIAADEWNGCILRRRLDWDVHKQTLLLEGQFQRCYRMKVESFEILQSFIRTALVRDELQSRRRTGTDPISPENMLQMTIAWLAGSGYQVSRCLGGTSVSAVYSVLHEVMDAIC
ncbi:hypothetical protein L915_13379, partial [Phytophthora nicotianae]